MTAEMHPVTGAVMVVLAGATLIVSGWMTVIAFVGGTMPVLGLETHGGFAYGMFWMMIVDPIIVTIAYWIASAVALVLTAVLGPHPDRERP